VLEVVGKMIHLVRERGGQASVAMVREEEEEASLAVTLSTGDPPLLERRRETACRTDLLLQRLLRLPVPINCTKARARERERERERAAEREREQEQERARERARARQTLYL